MARYLYSELAGLVDARLSCLKSNKTEWFDKHEAQIEALVQEFLPSGSGFDNGTKIDFDNSHRSRLVFTTSFHHMNDVGYYVGWTEHTITVTPAFDGFDMRISGRNRNDIKEYIGQAFNDALNTDVEYDVSRDFPSFQRLNLEIKSEWIDQSRQRWYVTKDGVEFWTPEDLKYYVGTPYERCKAFCVEMWKQSI